MEKYVPPQMPDTRPDMRQSSLFVTSNAECFWNKMLLAELNAGIPRAAFAVAIEHGARLNILMPNACHVIGSREYRLRNMNIRYTTFLCPSQGDENANCVMQGWALEV